MSLFAPGGVAELLPLEASLAGTLDDATRFVIQQSAVLQELMAARSVQAMRETGALDLLPK